MKQEVYAVNFSPSIPAGHYEYNEYVSGNVVKTGETAKTTYNYVYQWGFFDIRNKGITNIKIQGRSSNSYYSVIGVTEDLDVIFIKSGTGTNQNTANISQCRMIIVTTVVAQVNVTFS